jgi:hypothetical protein
MKKKQTKISPPPTEMPTIPSGIFERIHMNIMDLNSSKFFAGMVMIMLNVGSKFIPVQFSKSAEEYLKMGLSKVILVFAMSWMGTRDIYTAIVLTIVFVILSDYLFNEESLFCIVPHHKRVLDTLNVDADGVGSASTETSSSSTSTSTTISGDLAKQTLELIQKTKKIIEGDNK